MIMVYQIMSGMKGMKESNYVLFLWKDKKKVFEMIAGQNKEPASHNVQLICS